VLILRDVVGFPSETVAEMLGSTTASVNSALNRARSTLEQQRAAGRVGKSQCHTPGDIEQSVVQAYVEAWYAADLARLAGLLKRDVVMTMPPVPVRYSGREAVAAFLASIQPREQRAGFRFVPTRANRQPALAVYQREPQGEVFRAWSIWVLGIDGDAIAEITAFADSALIPAFGLPTQLEPELTV
jgi:RNA polymerase sigma-70 factor (ECF subfamily)